MLVDGSILIIVFSFVEAEKRSRSIRAGKAAIELYRRGATNNGCMSRT